jgi:hypothetical protein
MMYTYVANPNWSEKAVAFYKELEKEGHKVIWQTELPKTAIIPVLPISAEDEAIAESVIKRINIREAYAVGYNDGTAKYNSREDEVAAMSNPTGQALITQAIADIAQSEAVASGLIDAAQVCMPTQSALRKRLENAAACINHLLELHREVLKTSQLRQQTINQLQKKVDEANTKK